MKNTAELIESLKKEWIELLQKIRKLETFLFSDDLEKIDAESCFLLWEQRARMKGYEKTLCERLIHELRKQYNEENKEA